MLKPHPLARITSLGLYKLIDQQKQYLFAGI
jgi:hypothetical protein